jgi:hypothetical protein
MIRSDGQIDSSDRATTSGDSLSQSIRMTFSVHTAIKGVAENQKSEGTRSYTRIGWNFLTDHLHLSRRECTEDFKKQELVGI